jgi:nicotinamide-nucleotide amidase
MNQPQSRNPTQALEKAWIISSGTELILGQSVDTNAAWLAAKLAAIGIRATRHLTVDDDRGDVRDAVELAARHSDLVILTGGLGPTDDDLTRYALADAAKCELALDPRSLEQIRALFERRQWPFSERNKIQAMIPAAGRAIENTCGTAPGIYVEIGGTPCYALPGVPFEMKIMFERDILPHIGAASAGRIWLARRLNCYGLGESAIGEKIRDLMAPDQNPRLGTTANLGDIGIRMNVLAASPAEAEARLDRTEAEVRRRLGTVIYGRESDTLASVLGVMLAARGETLATAESCTGGMIAEMITDISGSSGYFVGGAVTYSNELKERILGVSAANLQRYGAVCETVACEMASGARERFRSTYALATTGIAGPSGGTSDKPVGLVYIALASPAGVEARELRLGEDSPREVIRNRAARIALNLLRLRLVN